MMSNRWFLYVCLLLILIVGHLDHVFGSVSSSSYDSSESGHCRRKVTSQECTPIQNHTCFGVKLPYTHTSTELVAFNQSISLHQIQNELRKWESLRHVPKCWTLIQPLLCSFYFPKCHEGYIDLPSMEICKRSKNPCKVVAEALRNEWPPFFKCDNFPANCKNDLPELKYNTTPICMDPMIEIQNDFNNYEGFEGCALRCQDPIFTHEDHEHASKSIAVIGTGTFCILSFVVITFLLDWKSSKGYPSVIIFYINLCYLFATAGWLLQFLPNTKEDIICRKDSTIRREEPAKNQNFLCTMVYIIIHYFSNAAICWLIVFSYVWNLTCNAIGRIRERIEKQAFTFQFFSWGCPAILVMLNWNLGKIDADSITGVCYVGNDLKSRLFFVIIPICIGFILICANFIRGIIRLFTVSNTSSDFITPKAREEIKSNTFRFITFTILSTIVVITYLFLQFYQLQHMDTWQKEFREKILCHLNLNSMTECENGNIPNVSIIVWLSMMFFFGGVLTSSWTWTMASLRIWQRISCCSPDHLDGNNAENGNPQIQKHKMISKAFAKRHQLPGRLSISLCSTHEDPVGLNKLLDPLKQDENNMKESDASSEWAAALPHLIARRGGIIPPHSSNSCLSETSSQTAVRYLNHDERAEYKRNRRRDWFRMGRKKLWNRRGHGSSSSLESNPPSQILPAITALIRKSTMVEKNTQTSFEFLNNITAMSTAMVDKSMQSSLPKLHEIGTQTKKSATKKKKTETNNDNNVDVLKFLTSN